MAIILFNRAGMMPAGRLRGLLGEAVPLRRWICGEDDDGTPHQTLAPRGSFLICGRGSGAPLFVELRFVDAPYLAPGETLPPHACHALLSPPTTEDPQEADRVTALIVGALMGEPGGGAWCQMTPGGGWTSAAGMADLQSRLRAGDTLANAGGLLGVPGRPAPRAIAPPFHAELPRTDRLPTLAALVSGRAPAPPTDWQTLARGLDYCDPQGGWRVEPRGDGGAVLAGRQGRILVAPHAGPMPGEWISLSIGRSFWLAPGPQTEALRAHATTIAITCDIDTIAAGAAATRQVAKAMAMALLLIAGDLSRAGRLAGLANAAHAILFAPGQVEDFARTLAGDEVPSQLFIATAFHATQPGAISLSTAGLMPFVGREVEAWNAPGDLDSVGERLGSVLRYLLAQGPVLRHGDTLGSAPADRAVRVLLGTSRAQRPYAAGQAIPALWLEFGGARPYPPRAQPLAAGAVRRPGGFGRKGL